MLNITNFAGYNKPQPDIMSVELIQVKNRKQLRDFVEFPNTLYKDSKYYVPKLSMDELSTLDPKKNPAFEFSEAALYLAYKDGKLAGRVAAIVNHKANKKWNHKEVRFGWIDYIDDLEVSKALIDKVIEYGKAKGMEKIVGPLGFTDFDPEGMLVEGFEEMCTMVLLYNYPYYLKHMEALGFRKEIDWLEYKIFIPDSVPERIERLAKIIPEKYGVRVRKITRREIRKEKLGHKIFALVNETYKNLYNFTQLTEKLIDKYVNFYLGLIDLKYITLVEDKNKNIVAFGLSMPSIVNALRKCRGKLFPFGWYHIIKSLYFKHEDCVELLLIGVKAEYRNHGLLALIFNDLIPRYNKAGFKYGESNAELETNFMIQSPWDNFEFEQKKRRRVVYKDI